MDEAKKKICDEAYRYITNDLVKWIDDEIFTKTTFEELGKLYYTHTMRTVENLTVELLDAVIRTVGVKDLPYSSRNDYYTSLCEILDFEVLPKEIMADVQSEYNDIFVQMYCSVFQKYQAELTRIQGLLFQTKVDMDAIRKTVPSGAFTRDISTDEKKLYELSAKCNSLRTRKEMLEYALSYVNSKLYEFCDFNDIDSVWQAQKEETLKISKNKIYGAKESFSVYRDYVEILEDDVDREYVLFFKVKIYIIIENARRKYYASTYTMETEAAIDEYRDYLSKIPKIDDLSEWKKNDANTYKNALDKIIADYQILEELRDLINSSVCLRERKDLLSKTVSLFEQGEYEIFNNLIPIQIEGMFADYLRDTTTFVRFTNMNIYENAVLKDKIRILNEIKSDIYPEATEYFMFYFNNMIRNRVAHGRYKHSDESTIQDEIFSKELLLDTCLLIHMLSRKSETEKMYRFIHGYLRHYRNVIRSKEHPAFGALFNDVIGQKTVSDYDLLERYRPIQVAYWIVNPYYEKIYEQVDDKKDLLDLRKEFLSNEFWTYVLGRLNDVITQGYDYLGIHQEAYSVVKGLFRCDISAEVKCTLGKVNQAMERIKQIK